MPASPVPADRISSKQARRIALAAQGFAPTARRGIRHDRRHLGAVFDRIGLIQIDSVNVLVRSHYLPLFSRLGPWRRDLLHDLAYGRRSQRRLFEYWGHEASLLPVETQPLLRWRMARAERHQGVWGGVSDFARERPEEVEAVFAEVAARGPIGVSDLELEERRTGPWWGWHGGKLALEWLFWAGRVTTAGRRGFERLYDLPERVLPPTVLDQPTPAEDEAQRGLIRIAAAALGIATERDLRDYFRLDAADGKVRVAELVEAGALMPVAVEGWQQPAYLHPEAAIPSRVTARALLSPFDSLVWERQRTERLFGFRYRLEIYTPAPKRQHGYYVLPFLLGDRLVGRVDLKADRQADVLRVQAAYAEARANRPRVAAALAEELEAMAGWLGLERVEVRPRGDLAEALTACCS